MKKIFAYYLIVIASTFFSIMFMLNIHIEEPIKESQEIKTFNDSYIPGIVIKNNTITPKKESTYIVTNETDNKKDKIVENNREEEDNSEKIRIFKEEMIEGLIKQRNREFQGSNANNAAKDKNNVSSFNKVVVTPEKILKVQREMDFSKKAKAINLLLKLGPSDMAEITKMAQDGVTPQEGFKMMDILKKHLSEEEIKYLMDIVNEYFADNKQKLTPPKNWRGVKTLIYQVFKLVIDIFSINYYGYIPEIIENIRFAATYIRSIITYISNFII